MKRRAGERERSIGKIRRRMMAGNRCSHIYSERERETDTGDQKRVVSRERVPAIIDQNSAATFTRCGAVHRRRWWQWQQRLQLKQQQQHERRREQEGVVGKRAEMAACASLETSLRIMMEGMTSGDNVARPVDGSWIISGSYCCRLTGHARPGQRVCSVLCALSAGAGRSGESESAGRMHRGVQWRRERRWERKCTS